MLAAGCCKPPCRLWCSHTRYQVDWFGSWMKSGPLDALQRDHTPKPCCVSSSTAPSYTSESPLRLTALVFPDTNSTHVNLQKNTDVPTSQILAMLPRGWWQDLAPGVRIVAPNSRQPQPSAQNISTEAMSSVDRLQTPRLKAAISDLTGCQAQAFPLL